MFGVEIHRRRKPDGKKDDQTVARRKRYHQGSARSGVSCQLPHHRKLGKEAQYDERNELLPCSTRSGNQAGRDTCLKIKRPHTGFFITQKVSETDTKREENGQNNQ